MVRDALDLLRLQLARINARILHGAAFKHLRVTALADAQRRGGADAGLGLQRVHIDLEFLIDDIDENFDTAGFA